MKHNLKHIVEYIFVRIIAALLRAVPYRAALFMGWCAAGFSFYIVRYRVREAKRRIGEVFGERFSKSEIQHIAWISWRNFIFTVVETIRLPVSSRDWVLKVVDSSLDDYKKLSEWSKTGKGGIIATSHMGSWEMAALACLAYDIPLFSLAAQQKNKLVDEFYNRSRAGTGFEIVLRSASVKVILRKIKEGKMLAILSDVRGKTDALPVKFLGKTANVAEGMGFIARQTNVPVFPTMITRIGWGLHRYRIYDPIFPDPNAEKKADALRITQSFFDTLTKYVQNEPEQWFWFNKRWIFDPLTKKEAGSQ